MKKVSLSESAKNTRFRSRSIQSERSISEEYEEDMTIELVDTSRALDKDKESATSENSELSNIKSEKTREIDLLNHSLYQNDLSNRKHSFLCKIFNSAEFRKVINHDQDESKWYDMLAKIFFYDQILYEQCFVYQKKIDDYKKLTLDLAKNKQTNAQIIQDLKKEIAHLRVELTQQANDAHRRERELIISIISSILIQSSSEHRSHDINSAKHLIDTNSNSYNSWVYLIREKLDTNALMYINEQQRIKYALEQMNDSIFDVMQSWVANKISRQLSICYLKRSIIIWDFIIKRKMLRKSCWRSEWRITRTYRNTIIVFSSYDRKSKLLSRIESRRF